MGVIFINYSLACKRTETNENSRKFSCENQRRLKRSDVYDEDYYDGQDAAIDTVSSQSFCEGSLEILTENGTNFFR